MVHLIDGLVTRLGKRDIYPLLLEFLLSLGPLDAIRHTER